MELKQFTGTKTIMAQPMSRTEAQQVLNRTIESSNNEEEGFFVQYPDGYKSWSPKSAFEKAYRPSETILDRMRIEYDDVKSRLLKLNSFMLSEEYRELPMVSANLLGKQSITMSEYLSCLGARIDQEKKMQAVKEAQEVRRLKEANAKSLVGMTVVSAGRCDHCAEECAGSDCKKLILADGSHICLVDKNVRIQAAQ